MAYVVGKFKYHSVYQGDEGLVLNFPDTAGQAYKAGDLVKLTSGKLVISTAASADRHLGFALTDSTGVVDTLVPVQVIRPADVFIVKYQPGDTFVITDINNVGYVAATANNTWYIDNDSTTAANVVFIVLGSLEYDARGILGATDGGAAYVHFNPDNIVFGTGV